MQTRDFIEPVDVELGESLRHDHPLREADPARFGFADWDKMKTVILHGGDPRARANKAA